MAVTWKKLAYEDDACLRTLFNANTILKADVDNTPVALEVSEQTVVGRLTGGVITDVSIGISDDNMIQVDGSPVNDDYAKFTANGLEGRSYSEALGDLSGNAAAAFDWNDQQLTGMVIEQVANSAALNALDPVVGKLAMQVDTLSAYICTVAA